MCEVNKEVEYLRNKFIEVTYDPECFKLYIGEGKFIFGTLSPKDNETPLSKLAQYRTLYDTLRDLDWKIKISFEKGVEYAYSKEVQDNFNPLHSDSEEESLAYYYIENALFRTSSLWDMLAQLYNLFYQIDIEKDKVYYNKIFNPNSPNSYKFKEKTIDIKKYIDQENDTNIDGEWKGNHKYINSCRNKMTHRNSPNISVLSDYDFNLKDHPSFMLKRIIEDYNIVSNYLKEILDEIEEEVMKDLT